MAYVYINSLEICNEERELLSYNEDIQAYEVGFNPKTTGRLSPFLYLRVSLELDPRTPIEVKFALTDNNKADFKFNMGTGDKILYVREVQHFIYVYLKFQLRTLKPIKNCLQSRLQLIARDSISNAPNSSQRIVRIKGF